MAAKKQDLDVGKILNSLSNKSSKKGDSSVPVINNPHIAPKVDTVVKLKQASKDAEALFRLEESFLIEEAKKWYEKNRGSQKSIRFMGKKSSAMIVFANKFSSIDFSERGSLQKIVGKDYNKYFEEVRYLSLKEEATDDKSIKFLLETLGKKKFAEMFDVCQEIRPTEDMERLQFSLPAKAKEYIVQSKPSLKIMKNINNLSQNVCGLCRTIIDDTTVTLSDLVRFSETEICDTCYRAADEVK